MFPLDPSDFALILDLGLATFLALYFALGHPRVWYRDRLGWVIFGYAAATVALLVLIVYGIVFGQKVHESFRLLVSLGLAVALISKIRAVYAERRAGREAASHPAPDEGNPMTTPKAKTEAVATVAEIWYKGQRVLRTLVAVVIPAFLSFALVLPAIIESLGLPVDSELRLWLVGVGGGVTAVALAITRIMAIPVVNAWLTKIGLGSVPAKAVLSVPDPETGQIEVVVAQDPKSAGE